MFEKPIVPNLNDFDMSDGGKFVPDVYKKRKKRIKLETGSEEVLRVSAEDKRDKTPFNTEGQKPESRINAAL